MRKLTKLAAVVLSAVMTLSMAAAADFGKVEGSKLDSSNPWGSGGQKEVMLPTENIDLAKIDKIVVKFENNGGYNQAIIGYNKKDASKEDGVWTTSDKVECSSNAGEVVLEGLEGTVVGGLQVQCWWINSVVSDTEVEGAIAAEVDNEDKSAKVTKYFTPGTVTLTDVKYYDKAGNEIKAAEPTAEPTKEAAKDDKTPEATKAPEKKPSETGDATNVLALAAIACVALAGVAVSSKKRA